MLIEEYGEEAFLAELPDMFLAANPVNVGVGDDAAVLAASSEVTVWSTDMLVEDVHFRRQWQSPAELGYKSLAVNLSDIAAMGAVPRVALLSLGLPKGTEVGFLRELCHGFASLARDTGVAIAGGDTTRSASGLVISVTLGGGLAGERAILRRGASAGDRVLVTGFPGRSAAGLKLAEAGDTGFPSLREAFIAPRARLNAGKAAAAAGITAMTDVSDGLASDLRHICAASGTGARIDAAALPVDSKLREAAAGHGWGLEELMLRGGEDYELLMTVPAERAPEAIKSLAALEGVPVTDIGVISGAGDGIILTGADGSERAMPARGFDHFQP